MPQPSQTEADLQNLLQHLYSLHSTKIDLSLDRVYRFLDKIGNPHLKLPPVIHAAGTNGKGSTLAALRAMLEASNKRVHFYSSPHLVHPTERIYLAGQHISSEDMLTLLRECVEINDGAPITFFEITTAAAMLAMSRVPADYCLLETGMGGRLDTTNVVPDPVCTIITSIGYDHQDFLGGTLDKIAAEKAGIMKPGVPCIIGAQRDDALRASVLDVFQQKSTDLSPNAPLVQYGVDWRIDPGADGFTFSTHGSETPFPEPNLIGNHQYRNIGAALAALCQIDLTLFDPDKLSTAIQNIHWQGRLEQLTQHPFCDVLPADWDLYLDGGHNEDAGYMLSKQAENWEKQAPKPLDLIVAMVARKDPKGFLKPLLPFARSLTATTIDGEEYMHDPEDLADTAKELGFETVSVAETPLKALKQCVSNAPQTPSRILICGSLYLAGDVLSAQKSP